MREALFGECVISWRSSRLPHTGISCGTENMWRVLLPRNSQPVRLDLPFDPIPVLMVGCPGMRMPMANLLVTFSSFSLHSRHVLERFKSNRS